LFDLDLDLGRRAAIAVAEIIAARGLSIQLFAQACGMAWALISATRTGGA
jgi:hypothetical protein